MIEPFGEPLLDDGRLTRIEERIRLDFPKLPEYCEFVSYVQPPQMARLPSGIDVQIPETAVLAILVSNYRHRDSFRMFQTGEKLDVWQKREWLRRHDSTVDADPAYHAMKALVPEILDWDANLRAMN